MTMQPKTILRELAERRELVLAGKIRWGRWKYAPETPALVLCNGEEETYWYPLDRMADAATVLDAIAQVAGKHHQWMTSADVGDFVRALNEIFHLQATCCGGGRNSGFSAKKILAGAVPHLYRPQT